MKYDPDTYHSEYDQEVRALYVYFYPTETDDEGIVARSHDIGNQDVGYVVADYDADDDLIGVELLANNWQGATDLACSELNLTENQAACVKLSVVYFGLT